MVTSERGDRVVVISGASSGIGAATAERFAACGDKVINADLVAPTGPSSAEWLPVDVTDWDAVGGLVADVEQRYGRVDVAIANAGVSYRRPILEIDRESISRLLGINLLGVFRLWQASAAAMMRGGGGTLLATASTNGNVGYPYYVDYNASKAAVLSMVRSFALEFSPRVRTACVSPGYVITPMQRAEYTDEQFAELNTKLPLGRHATPEEIADAFVFLADSPYISGQQLIVDGGELAGGIASRHSTAVYDT